MTDVPGDPNAAAQPDHRHEFAVRYLGIRRQVIAFLRTHSSSLRTVELEAIADEVIEITWKNWEKVRSMEKPVHWVLRVARNQMIDHGKSTRALPKPLVDSDVAFPASAYVDPETRAVLMETLEDMLELPPHLREALLLRGYGFSTKEIAGLMKIKPHTVTNYLRDARSQLAHISDRPRRRNRSREKE